MRFDDVNVFEKPSALESFQSKLAAVPLRQPDVGSIEPIEQTSAQKRGQGLASLLQRTGFADGDPRRSFQMSQKLLRTVDPYQQGGIGEFFPGFSYQLAQERGDKFGQLLSTIDLIPGAALGTAAIKAGKAGKGIESLSKSKAIDRAKEMGFRTDEPVYHGTHSKDLDAFDDKFIGDRDEGFFGRGHYFTSEPGEASYYGPNVGEYYTRGKLLDLSPTKANSNRELQDIKYFKFWTKELDKLDMLDEPTKKGLKTINKIDDYVDKNVKVIVGQNSNGTTGFTASVKHPTREPYVFEDAKGVKRSIDETLDSPLFRRGDGVEFQETKEKAIKALKDKIIYEAQTFNELKEVFPDLDNTLFSLSDYIRVGGKGSAELTKQAKKAGFDGIKVGDETVIFDPKNIRLVDAKFDPKKSESSKLLAGVSLPIAAAASATAIMEGENKGIDAL